jgi:hypothetical protein
MAIGAKVKVRVVVVPMVWLWDGYAAVVPPTMVWTLEDGDWLQPTSVASSFG